MSGIFGKVAWRECALSTVQPDKDNDPKLEALLEAARRATWDALHGPSHLRSGRFRPEEALKERPLPAGEIRRPGPKPTGREA